MKQVMWPCGHERTDRNTLGKGRGAECRRCIVLGLIPVRRRRKAARPRPAWPIVSDAIVQRRRPLDLPRWRAALALLITVLVRERTE